MRKRQSFALVCSIGMIAVMAALFLASPQQAWAQSATKSIELSFATHIPAKASPYHGAFLPWAKEIEKRTNGMIKIEFYLYQSLWLSPCPYCRRRRNSRQRRHKGLFSQAQAQRLFP